MIIIWLLYFALLAVWAILSFLAIRQVLKYSQPGIGVHKAVIVYSIFSAIVIIISLITMLRIDWDYLIF